MPGAGGGRKLLHDNERAALQRVSGLTAGARHEAAGRWDLFDGAVPEVPAFDIATSCGPPLTAADLAGAVRWFAGRPFSLLLRGGADRSLIDALAGGEHAVEPGRTEGAYAFDGTLDGGPAPDGLEVVIAREEACVRAYGNVGWGRVSLGWVGVAIARRAWALGFDLLLGLLHGEPVSCSMAACTGEVVGIYNVAVEPEYRGRGIGSHMTLAALRAGRRRGARVGYLRARDEVASVYIRLGFRRVFDYHTYYVSGGH